MIPLHPRGVSRPWGGQRLRSLCGLSADADRIGEAYVHEGSSDPRLLIKWLDAQANLSVQNHPSSPEKSKREIWYFVEPPSSGRVVTGYRGDISAPFRESELLYTEVKAGEVLEVPAGVLHALTAGCLVYEISEPLDVTYRVYDWERQGRELHIQKARASLSRERPILHKLRIDSGVLPIVARPEFELTSLVGPCGWRATRAAVLAFVKGPKLGQTFFVSAGESASLAAGDAAIATAKA